MPEDFLTGFLSVAILVFQYMSTPTKPSAKISRIIFIAALMLLVSCASLFAEKTDVVVLANGDKITGEIKKLERGKLEFKTDDMGTVYMDWTKITQITSKRSFDVELQSGERHIGTLPETTEARKMVVSTDEGTIILDILSVVLITPIEARFKERFKGYIDVGFSFQKANQLTNWILGTDLTYRTVKWATKAEGFSYFSKQKGVEGTTRHSLSLRLSRLMKNRWQASLLTMIQHNEELGLKLRATFGGGAGRHLVQTNQILLLMAGGAAATREQFFGSDEVHYNAELLGALSLQAFRFDDPKLDATLGLTVYPSITDFGRVRMEFNGRVRYQLFKDFYGVLRPYSP